MRLAGCLVVFFLAVQVPLWAETPSWVGREAEIETMLREGQVVEMDEVGHGVTDPMKVTFEHEGVTFNAVFKPIKRGRHKGFWESYQAEVAAYQLDKVVGLQMVPPTIKRTIKGKTGSLQWWVDGCESYGAVQDRLPSTPTWSQQLSRMKMFDNLIYNADRNARNFLVDGNWNIVLIDHSRAFLDRKKLLESNHALPVQYDRQLMERLKTVELEQLKQSMDGLLMGGQVKSILNRRDAILEHMSKLIAERGEGSVLFN